MSVSKEDILNALKEKGIHSLEDLTNAAVEAKTNPGTLNLATFVSKHYVVTG